MSSRRRKSVRRRPLGPLTRYDEWLTAALVVGLLVLVFAYLPSDLTRSYSGVARVIDGDRLVVGRVETRLAGIDAPEPGQMCFSDGAAWPCGKAARGQLRDRIAGRPVTCRGAGRDGQGAILAECRLGDRLLNAELVAAGWAVSDEAYQAQERAAEAGERGIWASRFDRPVHWRNTYTVF